MLIETVQSVGCEKSLYGSVCLMRLNLGIAALFTRHIKICGVDLRCHRLGAEIIVKALMIPDNPEFVVVVYLVAYLLAACHICHYAAAEVLAVQLDSAACVHIVADIGKNGAFCAVHIFHIIIIQRKLSAVREPALLIELELLYSRNLEGDILLLCAVNERSIYSSMRCYRHRHHYL